MDILIIVLNSVMVNCELGLYRRNYDFERFSLSITELLLLQQLPIASVALLLWSEIAETISVAVVSPWSLCPLLYNDYRGCGLS